MESKDLRIRSVTVPIGTHPVLLPPEPPTPTAPLLPPRATTAPEPPLPTELPEPPEPGELPPLPVAPEPAEKLSPLQRAQVTENARTHPSCLSTRIKNRYLDTFSGFTPATGPVCLLVQSAARSVAGCVCAISRKFLPKSPPRWSV